jgi:serine phosphatase RsbU (regulator of sigma subunit)
VASSTVFDPEQQARTCLDEAVRILSAERAYLFLRNDGDDALRFAVGRDSSGNDLGAPRGYSTTVVERARATRSPLVVSGTDEALVLGSESAQAHDLRSIIVAPLMVRDELAGVVYLDSRIAKGIFTGDDVEILLAIASHIAVALASARAAQMELERKALEKDLAVTAAVQSLLLPQAGEMTIPGVSLAGAYRAATQSGGDWWWYEAQEDGRLLVLLGDVTGHGAGAAMVTAAVASCYHSTRSTTSEDVPALLAHLHRTLRRLCKGEYTMTLVAALVDPPTGRLDLWSAAAPAPLLSRGTALRPIVMGGSALGGEAFELGHVSEVLAQGERVLFFTDGLPELKVAGGRRFGARRVGQLLSHTSTASVVDARESMLHEIDAARGNEPQEDDVTFALLGRT